MPRQMEESTQMRIGGSRCEGAFPVRSLVPAAQAQAARSRYAAIGIAPEYFVARYG